MIAFTRNKKTKLITQITSLRGQDREVCDNI